MPSFFVLDNDSILRSELYLTKVLANRIEGEKKSCIEHKSTIFCQVGYTIGWTALSSLLSSFKERFGPPVLLQLNLAYFLPSIPVLFLQTQYDSVLDHKFGLPRTMAIRMVLGKTSVLVLTPEPGFACCNL